LQIATLSSLENKLTALLSEQNIKNMAQRVDLGGKVISHGILSGSEFLQKRIERGGKRLKENMQPSEKPLELPETILSTLEVAKTITPHFVRLSDTLVAGVSIVAKELAGTASDAFMQKINEKYGKSSGEKDVRIEAAKELGKTTLVALANIWNSLEEAGMTLLESTGNVAVEVISHKYGSNAGQAARDGFGVAGDVIKTGQALKSLGAKSIAKSVAKESTVTILGTKVTSKIEYTQIDEMEDDLNFINQLPTVPKSQDLPQEEIDTCPELVSLNEQSEGGRVPVKVEDGDVNSESEEEIRLERKLREKLQRDNECEKNE